MTSAVSSDSASEPSATVLEMGDLFSVIQRGAGQHTPLRREFPLGVDSLVQTCLRHEPPLPLELEHAIELTEDVVMPLAAQFAGNTQLVLQGAGAALIQQGLQASGMVQTALTREELESVFNRLVTLSAGRLASQEVLPADRRFFAAMLLLRECMHHLFFTHVTFGRSNL